MSVHMRNGRLLSCRQAFLRGRRAPATYTRQRVLPKMSAQHILHGEHYVPDVLSVSIRRSGCVHLWSCPRHRVRELGCASVAGASDELSEAVASPAVFCGL